MSALIAGVSRRRGWCRWVLIPWVSTSLAPGTAIWTPQALLDGGAGCVQRAASIAPSLKAKSLHPHSNRHSTAVALLKSGVDFATIRQWLGHAGLNTTMRYARAGLDLKRRALAQAFPDAVTPPPGGKLLLDGTDLARWLRRL